MMLFVGVLLLLAPPLMAFAPSPSLWRTTTMTPVTTCTSMSVSSSSSSSTPPELERAIEVFQKFDIDDSGAISSGELATVLERLDLEASDEEAEALFRYLDGDGDGEISLDDFLPWYRQAVEAANSAAQTFQALLIGRRTVDYFDQTPVSDAVLRRAIECAIAAPNRSRSEPWRFIKVGPATVEKFAELHQQQQSVMSMTMETSNMNDDENNDEKIAQPLTDWTTIPGWCVVTTKLTPDNEDDDNEMELNDFKSTICAVQNFMLSMWSEGIGSKWTSGPVQKTQAFADLCGVDTAKERVAGCIWYGFATGGLVNADPKRRRKGVDDVLSTLP
jgi:nitroreductase